jgi:hypothetical protein
MTFPMVAIAMAAVAAGLFAGAATYSLIKGRFHVSRVPALDVIRGERGCSEGHRRSLAVGPMLLR